MSIDTSKVATSNTTTAATASKPSKVGAVATWADDRLGLATAMKKNLRKVFPDHWSFMLGEIALWSFVVLLLSGVFLTLWFTPSMGEVQYNGSYDQLRGIHMSEAYASTLHISFDVRGDDPQVLRRNAFQVIDHAQVMSIATNLGDTKSIISHSATTSHGMPCSLSAWSSGSLS